MAYVSTSAGRVAGTSSVLALLAAPFVAFGRGLVALAERDSRMQEVKALNTLSDEELAQRGTSRTHEIRRIFASSGHI